jgi:hypothetical protein
MRRVVEKAKDSHRFLKILSCDFKYPNTRGSLLEVLSRYWYVPAAVGNDLMERVRAERTTRTATPWQWWYVNKHATRSNQQAKSSKQHATSELHYLQKRIKNVSADNLFCKC